MWIGCDDGVSVGVDVGAFDQIDSVNVVCKEGVGGEGVIDMFVPFVRCIFLVPVLWVDEYGYGFPLV